jgi:hypothetical protein
MAVIPGASAVLTSRVCSMAVIPGASAVLTSRVCSMAVYLVPVLF